VTPARKEKPVPHDQALEVRDCGGAVDVARLTTLPAYPEATPP